MLYIGRLFSYMLRAKYRMPEIETSENIMSNILIGDFYFNIEIQESSQRIADSYFDVEITNKRACNVVISSVRFFSTFKGMCLLVFCY